MCVRAICTESIILTRNAWALLQVRPPSRRRPAATTSLAPRAAFRPQDQRQRRQQPRVSPPATSRPRVVLHTTIKRCRAPPPVAPPVRCGGHRRRRTKASVLKQASHRSRPCARVPSTRPRPCFGAVGDAAQLRLAIRRVLNHCASRGRVAAASVAARRRSRPRRRGTFAHLRWLLWREFSRVAVDKSGSPRVTLRLHQVKSRDEKRSLQNKDAASYETRWVFNLDAETQTSKVFRVNDLHLFSRGVSHTCFLLVLIMYSDFCYL